MSELIERPDRLQLTHFKDMVTHQPAPWLVRDLLRESSVACLYGHRGSYKSFVAMSVAASVSTGVSWLGHDVLNAGLVIYIAAEGGGGMVQRTRALSKHFDLPPAAFNFQFITEPMICMRESEDMDLLVERVKEAIGWEPAGYTDPETGETHDHAVATEWPRLIVVDTLARCFMGDENKQEDMGAFVQGIDRMKMEFDCTMLIIHHTGLDQTRPRGSTVLESACDTVYSLEADEAEPVLTLTCKKMKDSGEPDPLEMSWQKVAVERLPSDEETETLTSIIIGLPGDAQEDRKAMMMEILFASGPLSWLDWLAATGLPRASFARYCSQLKDSGLTMKVDGLWMVSE